MFSVQRGGRRGLVQRRRVVGLISVSVLRDLCKGPALSTRQEWWVTGDFCITHQCHSPEGSFFVCFKEDLKLFFPLIPIPVVPFQVRNVQVGRKRYVMWLCSLCKNYYLLLLTLLSSVTKSVGIHSLTLFMLEVDYKNFIWQHCPHCALPEVTHKILCKSVWKFKQKG